MSLSCLCLCLCLCLFFISISVSLSLSLSLSLSVSVSVSVSVTFSVSVSVSVSLSVSQSLSLSLFFSPDSVFCLSGPYGFKCVCIHIYMHILTSMGSLIAGSGIRVLFVCRPGPSGLRREGGASLCEEIRGGSEVARAQRRNSNLVRHPASVGTLDKAPGHSFEGHFWDQRPR